MLCLPHLLFVCVYSIVYCNVLSIHFVTADNIAPSPAEEACPQICLDTAYDEGYQASLAEAVPEEAFPEEEPSPEYSGGSSYSDRAWHANCWQCCIQYASLCCPYL